MSDPILVAIPTCDRPALLAEALASVLAQDDPDWLAVVADDGEGPPVAEDPRLPRDPRIHHVRATTCSAGGARNAAVVEGERLLRRRGAPRLVAFLDDDDLWRPGHLRASRAALASAPDAALGHGATVTRDPAGRETPYGRRAARAEAGPLTGPALLRLLGGAPVATSSVVVRGEAFRAVGGFRADLRHGEDWDLWCRLAERGLFAWVGETTVVHREHGGNVSLDLVRKASDQCTAAATWWRRRHRLAAAERAALRATLVRRHVRRVRRMLASPRVPRSEVEAAARAAWFEVPHLRTLLARVAATMGRRPREDAP